MTDTPTISDVHARCISVLSLVAPMLNSGIPTEGIMREFRMKDMDRAEAQLVAALDAIRAVRSEQVAL